MDKTAQQQAMESVLGQYKKKTVLAVGAHPDDLELGVGGTLARLVKQGTRVVMVVVCVPNHLESRVAEAKKAAEILGCEIKFLFAEREMRVEDLKTYELVDVLDKLVREYDPAAVLSHAASNFHKDHVLVHNACLSAQRLHFFDFYCYYPISCHPVTTPFHPQAYVDISEYMDRKMEAIHQHTTQFTCRGLGTDVYRDMARQYGRLAGVEYAEGLEVVRLRLG
jgi:N-acetylglucosamine malate deacetylase 1